MNDFLIPAGAGEAEHTEKRSRFLGHVRCVENEEQARAFIAEMKKQYYDARHNCWCYIIHDGPERYSDDGEPQGSAGLPMLEVLRRQGVSNAVCVVTRYFGGVLLGTGGLLRAYTKSAKDALDNAGVSTLRCWAEITMPCPYSMAESLKSETALRGGVVTDVIYGAEVTINALVPKESAQSFADAVFDLSSGRVTAVVTGKSVRAVKNYKNEKVF